MRTLSETEFKSEAEPILRTIFAGDDVFRQSFVQPDFVHKIIYDYHYKIEPPLIDAIISAARSIGDDGCYLYGLCEFLPCFDPNSLDPVIRDVMTMMGSSIGEPNLFFTPQKSLEDLESIPRRWYIPFFEFLGAYIDEIPQFDKFSLKSGLVKSHVIFSPQGKWGVILGDDNFGQLSGLPEFVQEVQKIFPEVDRQVYDFLNHIKIDYMRVNIDWLPVLLERMYGKDKAQALLTETGF